MYDLWRFQTPLYREALNSIRGLYGGSAGEDGGDVFIGGLRGVDRESILFSVVYIDGDGRKVSEEVLIVYMDEAVLYRGYRFYPEILGGYISFYNIPVLFGVLDVDEYVSGIFPVVDDIQRFSWDGIDFSRYEGKYVYIPVSIGYEPDVVRNGAIPIKIVFAADDGGSDVVFLYSVDDVQVLSSGRYVDGSFGVLDKVSAGIYRGGSKQRSV